MELPLPGYSLPAGFMMLFVFSWPATTLSSGTLLGGIEYQGESRALLGIPGFNKRESAKDEMVIMLRSY
ncbi:MAG: hypothetical protein C4583_04715 [Anaerolineaceae bacterium]|nr:MAG: hypothetical protein C4583_04715 [Anaerolineaceae bacterium]